MPFCRPIKHPLHHLSRVTQKPKNFRRSKLHSRCLHSARIFAPFGPVAYLQTSAGARLWTEIRCGSTEFQSRQTFDARLSVCPGPHHCKRQRRRETNGRDGGEREGTSRQGDGLPRHRVPRKTPVWPPRSWMSHRMREMRIIGTKPKKKEEGCRTSKPFHYHHTIRTIEGLLPRSRGSRRSTADLVPRRGEKRERRNHRHGGGVFPSNSRTTSVSPARMPHAPAGSTKPHVRAAVFAHMT